VRGFRFRQIRPGNPSQGKLTVYVGPMCSGKSDALITAIHLREGLGRSVQAFKPARDTRDGVPAIVSRTGRQFDATVLHRVTELSHHLKPGTDVVVLDEPHMMAVGFVQVVLDLINAGLEVLVAGLNLDFEGQPLAPMPELLCYATTMVPLSASYCSRCRAPASYSHRRGSSLALILPGGEDAYEPLCPSCWLDTHGEQPAGEPPYTRST